MVLYDLIDGLEVLHHPVAERSQRLYLFVLVLPVVTVGYNSLAESDTQGYCADDRSGGVHLGLRQGHEFGRAGN